MMLAPVLIQQLATVACPYWSNFEKQDRKLMKNSNAAIESTVSTIVTVKSKNILTLALMIKVLVMYKRTSDMKLKLI
ncbi:unnamed protein product [Adineta ricciae]|uniref:Uncharacterized protein n=1 Tax=Adineta ricciae TaxID=249248 RepID=A0A815G5Z6_ADIRI|nr:unnamed protein product [Adineta ricciae]